MENEKNKMEYHLHFKDVGFKCELTCGLGQVTSPLWASVFHWLRDLCLARS